MPRPTQVGEWATAEVVVNPHLIRRLETAQREHDASLTFDPEAPNLAVGIRHAANLLEEAAAPSRDRWLADPVTWVTERLGGEVWSRQAEILRSVRDYPETAVPTCHTVGKSYSAALLSCWWLDSHPAGEAFVVTTAPTGAQVKAILWRYIGRLHEDHKLPGRTNQTEWYIGSEIVAMGRKPSEYSPDAFQGIHSTYMLVIIDEATGVVDTLWDAASTLTSNELSRMLAIGNPDDPISRFARVCQPGSGWNVIQIGAEDTPAWTDEPVSDHLRQNLISRRWAEQKAIEWGVESPLYQSKVLGKFPVDAEDGVIPVSFITPCRYLIDDPTLGGEDAHGGIDVGESSDRTVIYERRGMRAGRHREISHNGDAMTSVGEIVHTINQWDLSSVTVDVIGIGWGVYSRLRELSRIDNPNSPLATHSAHVRRFSAAEQASDPTRFINKRAELWWDIGRELSRARAWDLTSCNDDVIAELTCPKYRIEGSRSRIQIESKDDIRVRLGRSPDKADALLMAFYIGDAPIPPASFPDANRTLAATVVG